MPARLTPVEAAERLRAIAREDRVGAASRAYRLAVRQAASEARTMPKGTERERVAAEDHERNGTDRAAAALRSVVESVTREREALQAAARELDGAHAGRPSDVAVIERGRDYWARQRTLLDAGATSVQRLVRETTDPEELAVLHRELPAYVSATTGRVAGTANGSRGIARAMAGQGNGPGQDWVAEALGRRLAEHSPGADGAALRARWDRDDADRIVAVDLDHASSLLDGHAGSGSGLGAAMATSQARAHADGVRREAGQRPLIAEPEPTPAAAG